MVSIIERQPFCYGNVTGRWWVKELTGRDLPGGHSTFTVSFEVKDVAELNTIQTKLLNIRDVIGARRGQN